MDFLEEYRCLSTDEAALRSDARLALDEYTRRQAAYRKQRGKCRRVREGDENTRFFHAQASQRRRGNCIRVLDVDGSHVMGHAAKAAALLGYYSGLLGRATAPVWRFDVVELLANAPRVDGPALVAPFAPEEIKRAAFCLDRTSAPGPDGLGPAFYHAAWPTVGRDVERLFAGVYNGSARLDGINRAFIALLPKGDGVPTPGGFRPVSLQNADVKILCRGLTTRLQAQIGVLIDEDQSGFIPGRSIAENFVYAAEMVQCCYKRAAPTIVLKLDFAKAFDSINWESLRAIAGAGVPGALV